MTTPSTRSATRTVHGPPARTAAAARSMPPAVAGTSKRSTSVRVLCVDDHAVLVEGLRAQFALDGAIEVVGSLETADRLLEEVERLRPQVVLLDIEMPGADAFEMADRLRQLHPQVRVIILSAHVRDSYLSAAYKAGACGYFSKSDDLEAIVDGVRAIGGRPEGGFVMGPKVQQRCLSLAAPIGAPKADAGRPPTTRLEALTDRELEVLRLIGRGLSRSEIATQLSRSAKTVDGHQDRIMRKLGVESRADLLRYAIREGLAEA